MGKPQSKVKSFAISKQVVWRAWEQVRANQGAAGVDEQSIAEFEADLERNLYKLWNRLSSGSYMPSPVRAVQIPKKDGQGVRVLGVPTVADRVAQTVVKLYLEPEVESVFHPDSYGYRPERSALDAVKVCRERCWRWDWVIDLDIRSFFDMLDHELILRAVAHHTDQRWILLYVQRWLTAPFAQEDGTLVVRDRGTPQGSAISPLLANIFLHYAFDLWMEREFPAVRFERYADDVIVHCNGEQRARGVLDAIAQRMARCHLELHPEKTRIVYCKDANRKGSYEHEQFTFLGFTFRPRLVRNKGRGQMFVSFSPALSNDAAKAIRRTVKRWRLHRRSMRTLTDLATSCNMVVQGWINYYGGFYPRKLIHSLKHINHYLMRWAMKKYKRLRGHPTRAWKFLETVAARQPDLFAHWRIGAQP